MSGVLRESIPGIGAEGERIKIISTFNSIGRMKIRTASGKEFVIDSARVDKKPAEEPKS